MADASPAGRFRAAFDRWSRRVRRRLALEAILTGASLGLAAGAAGAAVAWQTRHGDARPWMAAGGLLGAAAGTAAAARRRWPETSVALYLDGKLGSNEAIATALELEPQRTEGGPEDVGAARAAVLAQAATALEGATSRQVRAPMWRPWHAGAPLAAAAIGYLSWLPLPPAPALAAAPTGADAVRLAEVAGLEKIAELAELDARDPAQRERLRKLAEDAKKLREKLRSGVEKREALADLGRMRDAITAERLSLGEGEQRQGMESALGKLGENQDLRRAAKALGDRDLVALDEEMERLANKLEKNDRDRARKTLEEAEEAAKKAGAPGVAKALEEQRKRLEQRGKNAEKLRELAEALGDRLGEEGREALREMGSSGGGKSAQKLAESLEKALGALTDEERKRLAENLKKQAAGAGRDGELEPGAAPTDEQLREMAKQLATPEGQRELAEQLRRMAEAPTPGSDEAERQKALDGAQEGAGQAEGQLGGKPMPIPVAGGPGQQGKPGPGGAPGAGSGDGQAGHSDGGGPGSHAGQTGAVAGGELKSRATAKINQGKPMPGMVMGRATGRSGETANVQGEGALGAVGPGELGGIERSEVPEEYREQVGRYFQPK